MNSNIIMIFKKNLSEIDVSLFDTQLSSTKEIFESLVSCNPSIIGISVKPGTIKITTEIINGIKDMIASNLLDKRTITVLWGAMPSINPHMFIDKYPDVFVGMQEWEYTLEWLVDYYKGGRDIKEVPNLVYKSDNWNIVFTIKKSLICKIG